MSYNNSTRVDRGGCCDFVYAFFRSVERNGIVKTISDVIENLPCCRPHYTVIND
jgi:hypothetical protein